MPTLGIGDPPISGGTPQTTGGSPGRGDKELWEWVWWLSRFGGSKGLLTSRFGGTKNFGGLQGLKDLVVSQV